MIYREAAPCNYLCVNAEATATASAALPVELRVLSDAPTLYVRQAHATASLLLFICVLGQPLVFAHVNGFTIHGFVAPERTTRALCMIAIQKLAQLAFGAVCYAFMVGEYVCGARLFTAPL